VTRPLVIIPTYNERDNIAPITRAVLDVAPTADILVVDDNSPDGTGRIADELAAQAPRIHVLHRAGKEGLGRAYLAGFDWALAREFDPIFEMDADFSHDPKYLPKFLEEIQNGADVVLGSRYVRGGGTVNWGLSRQAISKGGSLYARTILGVGIRDLTGGFKCFRRSALAALDLGTVRSTGYAFQIELTYRAVRRGLRVVEIPIIFEDRRVGQSKMSRRIFVEAATMVWRLRFGSQRT
jgi:dolichol-phosphate mannosyltransferase